MQRKERGQRRTCSNLPVRKFLNRTCGTHMLPLQQWEKRCDEEFPECSSPSHARTPTKAAIMSTCACACHSDLQLASAKVWRLKGDWDVPPRYLRERGKKGFTMTCLVMVMVIAMVSLSLSLTHTPCALRAYLLHMLKSHHKSQPRRVAGDLVCEKRSR